MGSLPGCLGSHTPFLPVALVELLVHLMGVRIMDRSGEETASRMGMCS